LFLIQVLLRLATLISKQENICVRELFVASGVRPTPVVARAKSVVLYD
jgi:hypothetical protein